MQVPLASLWKASRRNWGRGLVGCQHSSMGAKKARKRLIQELDNDSTERLHQNWQVICSMMVPVCPTMVSTSTLFSLLPSPFVSRRTVCPAPYQVTCCPTMPHYRLVRQRKLGKLMSKLSTEAAVQLTLGHCCVRINSFFFSPYSYCMEVSAHDAIWFNEVISPPGRHLLPSNYSVPHVYRWKSLCLNLKTFSY